jgi:hypothetical protein
MELASRKTATDPPTRTSTVTQHKKPLAGQHLAHTCKPSIVIALGWRPDKAGGADHWLVGVERWLARAKHIMTNFGIVIPSCTQSTVLSEQTQHLNAYTLFSSTMCFGLCTDHHQEGITIPSNEKYTGVEAFPSQLKC